MSSRFAKRTGFFRKYGGLGIVLLLAHAGALWAADGASPSGAGSEVDEKLARMSSYVRQMPDNARRAEAAAAVERDLDSYLNKLKTVFGGREPASVGEQVSTLQPLVDIRPSRLDKVIPFVGIIADSKATPKEVAKVATQIELRMADYAQKRLDAFKKGKKVDAIHDQPFRVPYTVEEAKRTDAALAAAVKARNQCRIGDGSVASLPRDLETGLTAVKARLAKAKAEAEEAQKEMDRHGAEQAAAKAQIAQAKQELEPMRRQLAKALSDAVGLRIEAAFPLAGAIPADEASAKALRDEISKIAAANFDAIADRMLWVYSVDNQTPLSHFGDLKKYPQLLVAPPAGHRDDPRYLFSQSNTPSHIVAPGDGLVDLQDKDRGVTYQRNPTEIVSELFRLSAWFAGTTPGGQVAPPQIDSIDLTKVDKLDSLLAQFEKQGLGQIRGRLNEAQSRLSASEQAIQNTQARLTRIKGEMEPMSGFAQQLETCQRRLDTADQFVKDLPTKGLTPYNAGLIESHYRHLERDLSAPRANYSRFGTHE